MELNKKLIHEARQEAHSCNSSEEVLEWIDWFEKKLDNKTILLMAENLHSDYLELVQIGSMLNMIACFISNDIVQEKIKETIAVIKEQAQKVMKKNE